MNTTIGLLLVHAFPGDGSLWEKQSADLRAPGRPILAPSLPGFGGTPVPTAEPSLDDYADALIREIDRAGWAKAVVCGLSMGGYVAFALWRRHQGRIAGLVLADAKAEADTEQGKTGRVALAAKVRELGPEQTFFAATPPPWLREGSSQWPLLKATILRQPREAIAQAALARAGRPDSLPDLASIHVPTAVIVGDADPICTLDNAKTMQAGIKGATLTVIRDAGHLASLEQPEPFDAAVSELLQRVGI